VSRTSGERYLEVVAYDCSDDARRARMANLILSYGARVQGSVYEVWLTRRDRETLWHRLLTVARSEDSPRSYTLCGNCVRGVRCHGSQAPSDEPVLFG
jgi:CRISPR-associated protein Cas2